MAAGNRGGAGPGLRSRFELFERSGHLPHLYEPERFVRTLEDWIATTGPAQPDEQRLRAAVRRQAAGAR